MQVFPFRTYYSETTYLGPANLIKQVCKIPILRFLSLLRFSFFEFGFTFFSKKTYGKHKQIQIQ